VAPLLHDPTTSPGWCRAFTIGAQRWAITSTCAGCSNCSIACCTSRSLWLSRHWCLIEDSRSGFAQELPRRLNALALPHSAPVAPLPPPACRRPLAASSAMKPRRLGPRRRGLHICPRGQPQPKANVLRSEGIEQNVSCAHHPQPLLQLGRCKRGQVPARRSGIRRRWGREPSEQISDRAPCPPPLVPTVASVWPLGKVKLPIQGPAAKSGSSKGSRPRSGIRVQCPERHPSRRTPCPPG